MAAAILFIAAIVGYSIESKASVSDDLTKKQLKSCTVTSGGVIIQIGNTCDGSGDGCKANPCS